MILAAVALFVLSLLPGLILASIFIRDVRRLEEYLVIALVLSLGCTIGIGLLLSQAGMLRNWAGWAAYGAFISSLVILGHRRGQGIWPLFDAHWRSWDAALFLLILVPTIAIHIELHTKQPHGAADVSYAYLADVIQIAQEGRLPTETDDWGTVMDFEIDKVAWYVYASQVIILGGLESADIWQVMNVLAITTLAGLALTVWVFFRSVTKTRHAAFVGTVITLWNPWLITKAASFRGETFGLLLFFAALYTMRQALLRQSGRWHLWVGIIVALTATAHLIPAFVGLLAYGGMILAQFILKPRAILSQARYLFASGALALALILGIWFASGVKLGVELGGLSPFAGYDPTGLLNVMARGTHVGWHPQSVCYVPSTLPLTVPIPLLPDQIDRITYHDAADTTFYRAPYLLLDDVLDATEVPIVGWPSSRDGRKVLFLIGIVALGWCGVHFPSRQSLVLALLITMLCIFVSALYFSYRYNTWIPAFNPTRRQIPYYALLSAIGVTLVYDAAIDWLGLHGKRIWKPLALVVQIAFSAWLAIYAMRMGNSTLNQQRRWQLANLTPESLQSLAWLRNNTEPDARLLVDAYTAGVFESVAERNSVVEGRAPYTQPENLRHALTVLTQSYSFFENPLNTQVLIDQKVDYVIVGGDRAFGTNALATRNKVESHVDDVGRSLRRINTSWWGLLPYLELEAAFGPIEIYRVLPDKIPASYPDQQLDLAGDIIDREAPVFSEDITRISTSQSLTYMPDWKLNTCLIIPEQADQEVVTDYFEQVRLWDSLRYEYDFSTQDQILLTRWRSTLDPTYLRAAGVEYLWVNTSWWDQLTRDEQDVFADPDLYQLVRQWDNGNRPRFNRLYRVAAR